MPLSSRGQPERQRNDSTLCIFAHVCSERWDVKMQSTLFPCHQDMHAWTWAADGSQTVIEDVAFRYIWKTEVIFKKKKKDILISSPGIRLIPGSLSTSRLQFVCFWAWFFNLDIIRKLLSNMWPHFCVCVCTLNTLYLISFDYKATGS